jgi:hypothetical protein
VAQQTGIRTFHLPKSLRHVAIGDIVNLVSARAKKDSIHDAGHVTRNAPAAFRVDGMMRMGGERDGVLKLRMAVRAHQVRLIAEF